jgi:hypothetical protein
LNTAVAIAEEEGMTQNDLAEAIESLVDKSMVEARVDTHEASYTLLATTRAYAFEKLIHSGEHDAIAARHAYVLSVAYSPLRRSNMLGGLGCQQRVGFGLLAAGPVEECVQQNGRD